MNEFGYPLLDQFTFAFDYCINLNNGSYGAIPKSVLDKKIALTKEVESNVLPKFSHYSVSLDYYLARQVYKDSSTTIIQPSSSTACTVFKLGLE